MHPGDLTPSEQRVLGCLIEKRFTTPDQYPLSLNALRLACNQSTNREPVVSYDEDVVREAAQRLSRYGLARLASGHSSRSVKYRHLAEEALAVDRAQLALLCVMLLRGPQTPGELKQRTERMHRFDSLDEVYEVLDQLGAKGYMQRLERRPGQKEDRFEHLLGGSSADGEPGAPASGGSTSVAPAAGAPPAPAAAEREPSPPAPPVRDRVAERVTVLEAEVAALRAELRQLRELLD